MANESEKPAHISQADWDAADIPEITDEELARARPFKEMFPAQYAAAKNLGGRPRIADPKVHMGFRFASDLAARIKEGGAGASSRVEAILRQAMDEGRL